MVTWQERSGQEAARAREVLASPIAARSSSSAPRPETPRIDTTSATDEIRRVLRLPVLADGNSSSPALQRNYLLRWNWRQGEFSSYLLLAHKFKAFLV